MGPKIYKTVIVSLVICVLVTTGMRVGWSCAKRDAELNKGERVKIEITCSCTNVLMMDAPVIIWPVELVCIDCSQEYTLTKQVD